MYVCYDNTKLENRMRYIVRTLTWFLSSCETKLEPKKNHTSIGSFGIDAFVVNACSIYTLETTNIVIHNFGKIFNSSTSVKVGSQISAL